MIKNTNWNKPILVLAHEVYKSEVLFKFKKSKLNTWKSKKWELLNIFLNNKIYRAPVLKELKKTNFRNFLNGKLKYVLN